MSNLLRTSYRVWSGDFLNSLLTKTNLAPFKLLRTFSLILPWVLAGTGLRSPTLVELAEVFADWFL